MLKTAVLTLYTNYGVKNQNKSARELKMQTMIKIVFLGEKSDFGIESLILTELVTFTGEKCIFSKKWGNVLISQSPTLKLAENDVFFTLFFIS